MSCSVFPTVQLLRKLLFMRGCVDCCTEVVQSVQNCNKNKLKQYPVVQSDLTSRVWT